MIKNHLSLILTLIAVGLIAVGGIMAEYAVSDYGLIGGFPVLYFAGLGVLVVAFVLSLSSQRHDAHYSPLVCTSDSRESPGIANGIS